MKQLRLVILRCVILLVLITNAVSFTTTFLSSKAEAKEIAITFDDTPRKATGYFDGSTRAKVLIEGLMKAKIKEVAFFSVSSQLDSEGKQRLESYAKAGHIVANHTHTHPDFNKTSSADYIQDFKTSASRLAKFPNYENWFRFPYLREGDQLQKRDTMRLALAQAGYRNAYITINNYDWHMENLFQQQRLINPKLDFGKLRTYYVGMLIEALDFYDEMAIKHLGRSPKHVILLHETDMNALFITDLAMGLESRGWKIISPRDAYKDEISSYSTASLFKFNPGRIGEIAWDKGQKKGLWHESCDEGYLEKEFKKQVLQ